MERTARCNVGLMGIGGASSDSTMISTGYLSAADLRDTRDQGGVGDILSHYFTINGHAVRTWWSDHIMAINLNNFVNTLVTDMALADAVRKLLDTP